MEDILEQLIFRAKKIKLRAMRVISGWPGYMLLMAPRHQYKKKQRYMRYIQSEDSRRLKKYHKIHQGKRCFIIGNGPSLTGMDLNRLRDEYTFAANRIYEIFDQTEWRPTYYVAADRQFIFDNIDKLNNRELGTIFLNLKGSEGTQLDDSVERILVMNPDIEISKWNNRKAHISEDISHYISQGSTVTFAAIQLAIYMGFQEIYLLGVDFSYSIVRDKHGKIIHDAGVKDYFSGKKYSSTEQNYCSTLYAYEQAKKYCDSHGIVIRNATRGGKLEVFERVDFDSLF